MVKDKLPKPATPATTTDSRASQQVVQDYLDTLLRDVFSRPEQSPVTPSATASQIAPGVALETAVTTVTETALATKLKKSTQTDNDKPVLAPAPQAPELPKAAVPSATTSVATGTAVPVAAAGQARTRAAWADKPFASLLFEVMGLKLAAPLHDLGGIMPLEDRLQPMAGQADWFMGLIRWNGRTLRVVDTARFVMPEKMAEQPEAESLDYQSIVVLGDSHWALAVSNADQSVNLQPADVRWRTTSGKRPWLAGTVLERLCALLDVGVLISMLDASDTGRQISARAETVPAQG